jgi:hypothetical protein
VLSVVGGDLHRPVLSSGLAGSVWRGRRRRVFSSDIDLGRQSMKARLRDTSEGERDDHA